MEYKKVFDFHGEQMGVLNRIIRDPTTRCRTCDGKKQLVVSNGPDDYDVFPCPNCSLKSK